MKIQDILLSPTMNKLALWLGEHFPSRIGYWLAEKIALFIASRKKAEQVRAVRANQWVIGGKKDTPAQLNKAVNQVYINSSRCLYDFYHSMQRPERIKQKIRFDPSFEAFMRLSKEKKTGLLGLILHMGSFDLAGYAMAYQGMEPMILSYPSPNEAYQWQNELRRRAGLNVQPLSMSSLSHATHFLRDRGTVVTGIDRPWPDLNYHPRFFGEESNIPVTMIQLALKVKVPISILCCAKEKEKNTYCLFASPLIEMDLLEDRGKELIHNSEKVLQVAERYLKKCSDQWAMFYPVWPQAMDQMP